MFDISEKLIVGQSDEIYGVTPISWEDSSWKYFSLVGGEQVVSLSNTKVYVFSDSVLCLGKMNENPQSICALEDKLTWFKSSPEYRALDRIDGEPMEFEWNIFPGFTTLQLCYKVQEFLSILNTEPENLLNGSSSCRCSTTSHGDLRTTRKNASKMLNTSLSMQRDSEQVNGHSSDLDRRKSGTLLVKTVHMESGTELQRT